MYAPRELNKTFQTCIRQFPAILITGPRQSGKTTFLQHEMKNVAYLTFDDPLNRDFALQDANGFLDQFNGKSVILDEIQYVPEILQYIKIRIDKHRTRHVDHDRFSAVSPDEKYQRNSCRQNRYP